MGNLRNPDAPVFLGNDQSRQIEKILRELGSNLCTYITDPTVVEILYNADGTLWLERLGKPMEAVGILSASRAESLIYSLAAYHKTTITRDNPILECELPPYNARFEALIPPVVARPIFSIRCRPPQIFTLSDYVTRGIMNQEQKEQIMTAVRTRKNILVVGGTGTGKTTLTNAIIAEMVRVTPDHRLVIIEDTAEIQCGAKNAALLHAVDRVDMLRLLKASMRLRPDRILVGEVRGPEALALLKAWNTGHPGGVATLHANNARAGLIRLEQLIAESTTSDLSALIGEAVDLIISIQKTPDSRKIDEIIHVEGYCREGGYQIKA
jgi:P-type conjugative transfer ATPase TrbB